VFAQQHPADGRIFIYLRLASVAAFFMLISAFHSIKIPSFPTPLYLFLNFFQEPVAGAAAQWL
jgi:hypothetical protein